MAKDLFNRYLWLGDTFYRAGTITLDEINRKWLQCEISNGEEIPNRTFHNHRKAIEELFDINIECDRHNGCNYYIAQERLRKGEIDLNTYNRIKTKLGARFTGTVYQEMADSNSPEINAGKRYLEQLRADNNPLIGEYTIQRIDGTSFIYQFRNNEGEETFSVKVSYFVNEKKNVLYAISSLQKK